MERLGTFSFRTEYIQGEKIPHVDALSRAYERKEEINFLEDKNKKIDKAKIMEKHAALIHRGAKVVAESLKQDGFKAANMEEMCRDALKDCLVCKKYNVACRRPYRKVEAFEPGEMIAIDIMGPINNHYILTAIDYFSRKAWAKRIMSRKTENILHFVKNINNQLKIKTLICDEARENIGGFIRRWAEQEGIKIHSITPYHHQSNGKLERFHRTLMEGINKAKSRGSYDERIKNVVETYNTTWHSAIKMSPNNAMDPSTWTELKNRAYKNIMKQENPNYPILKNGQKVLVQKDPQRKKNEPRYDEEGTVVEALGFDTYLIKIEGKRKIKRHAVQLKAL